MVCFESVGPKAVLLPFLPVLSRLRLLTAVVSRSRADIQRVSLACHRQARRGSRPATQSLFWQEEPPKGCAAKFKQRVWRPRRESDSERETC